MIKEVEDDSLHCQHSRDCDSVIATFSHAEEVGILRQNGVERGLCGSASQKHMFLVTQDCHREGKTTQHKNDLKSLLSDGKLASYICLYSC